MEGIHFNSDAEDKDKISGVKKKSADKVGLFTIESKNNVQPKNAAEKRDDLLALLTGRTVKVETIAEDEELVAEEVQLTPGEEKLVENEIVLSQQELLESTAASEDDEVGLAADIAVSSFHDKILHGELNSTQALAETLAEINDDNANETNVVADLELTTSSELTPQELTEESIAIKQEAPETADIIEDVTVSVHDYSPSAVVTEKPVKRQESKSAGESLIGDLVSYLLGRRQEKIKFEKQLAPIQKKFEQQVISLQREIVAKEFTIRQAASERARNELAPDRLDAVGRGVAPEANHLHSDAAPERIGRVLVTAEADSSPKVETATLQPIDQHIETLSRADLLELSGKTVVDGSSLRQSYETNLISEKGLRRVVIEHLRGGDVRRALRRELVEHEIDFERDPQLRDKEHQAASSSGALLKKLLARFDVGSRYEIKSRLTFKPVSLDSGFLSSRHKFKRRVWMDIALMSIIGILLVLVLVLVLNHQ